MLNYELAENYKSYLYVVVKPKSYCVALSITHKVWVHIQLKTCESLTLESIRFHSELLLYFIQATLVWVVFPYPFGWIGLHLWS